MQLGMVGLGRMGGNLVRRLARQGHEYIVFDENPAAVASGWRACPGRRRSCRPGTAPRKAACRLGDAAGRRDHRARPSRPPGKPTGTRRYDHRRRQHLLQDDVRRAGDMKAKGIHYLDCGTSGGVWGLERGYCLMIGGAKEAVDRLDPIFQALSPRRRHGSPRRLTATAAIPASNAATCTAARSGAGHFVKMIHNGIEYGMMQAFAEGFEILKKASSAAHTGGAALRLRSRRRRRSLAARQRGQFLAARPHGVGAGRGSGARQILRASSRTRAKAAGRSIRPSKRPCPADVLSAALYARFRSRDQEGTANKLLSAMRHAFGGHVEPKK